MSERKIPLFIILVTLISAPALAAEQQQDQKKVSPLSLEVVLSETTLNVYLGEQVIRSYPVAIGKIDHPTPEGEFLIERMIWNPWWYPPDSEWADGLSPTRPGSRANPMRVVKIPFDPPYYYVHGTDRPESLGSLASHGCIRVSEATAKALGRLIMEFGGYDQSETALRQFLREKKERTVELPMPVRMTIRMGETDVYPGVVWVVNRETRAAAE